MPNEPCTRYDLNKLDERLTLDITELRKQIIDNTQAIAELNVKYDNLADLPMTINKLNNTLTVVSERLENMNDNMNYIKSSVDEQRQIVKNLRQENEHQNEIIDEIDNKSKIDWAKAITDNFWKVILVVGVLYAVFKDLL